MVQLIEQLHINSTKNNLKLAPENSTSKVNILGHKMGYIIIRVLAQPPTENDKATR